MRFSKDVAGTTVVLLILWLIWAVGAPLVVGHRPFPAPPHECPTPYMQHGVGKDLKPFVKAADRCKDLYD